MVWFGLVLCAQDTADVWGHIERKKQVSVFGEVFLSIECKRLCVHLRPQKNAFHVCFIRTSNEHSSALNDRTRDVNGIDGNAVIMLINRIL